MMKLEKATPIVKWIGGKRQLLSQLEARMPLQFNNYYEPFVGGGALFFHLKQQQTYRQFFISDINDELINTYGMVKDSPHNLIDKLKIHKLKHNKDYYYKIRSQHELKDSLERAARFLYLNKTCFNGLYRVNQKNQFNTPIGKYTNPNIVQEDNIIATSNILKDVHINTKSFETIQPKANDFVYFDPPYYPINKTSNFTNYTDKGFNELMQEQLKDLMDQLSKNGVLFMASNSDTPYTQELYSEYTIDIVNAKRAINSNASKRGSINEIIVRNY